MAYGTYYAPRNARRVARPASDKQREFARSLAEAVHGDNAAEFLAAHEEEGTFLDSKATSALIDALLERKREMPRAKAEFVTVPEPGYYAVEWAGALRFYAVRKGKGKWEGRTFLNRFRSDFQDRVYRAEQEAVFEAILADPNAARMTFARETTHCYVCGRRLTDETSRELGIGPDCRGRRA
jgi:Family of unknown function (DUF6011)